MTSKQPPRIATWMLKHFGSGPNNDSILGDLAEQFCSEADCSAIRQGLSAISEIWENTNCTVLSVVGRIGHRAV